MRLAQPFDVRNRRGIFLRLVLVVCAWQGPLPVVHAHAAAVDSVDDSAAESSTCLVEHLRTWHCGDEACSGECREWHLHFEYPHPSHDGTPTSQPAKDRLATIAAADFDAASSACGTPSQPASFSIDHDGRERSQLPSLGRNAAAHFFDGFAPTLPLPLRFGVMRC